MQLVSVSHAGIVLDAAAVDAAELFETVELVSVSVPSL